MASDQRLDQRLDQQLDRPHLCFVAGGDDPERARLHALLPAAIPVADRAELEMLLGRMLEVRARPRPKTLDLIGYATSGKLLSIGDWTIDGDDRSVLAFFRGLAEQDVLARLGVSSLRLIGSLTGATPAGMAAMRAIAGVLGVRVFGATELIYARHFDRDGYSADGALVSHDDDPTSTPPYAPPIEPRRELEVDALPARPLVAGERVAIVSRHAAQALSSMIARTAGTAMPGLLAVPAFELALPSSDAGAFHRLELLFSGSYVRVYPEGPFEPGVVFPVRDPHAALEIARGDR